MLSLSSLNINLYNALMSGASGYALSLDFLSGTLDSRITFTRGSNAMIVDRTGKLTYAPNNLVTNSEAFDAASWVKNNLSISANASSAPNGTTTADKAIPNTTTGDHVTNGIIGAVAAGNLYVFSVYAKADGYNFIRLSFGGVAGGGYTFFNVSTGVVGNTSGMLNNNIENVGGGWYRCSVLRAAVSSAGLDGSIYVTSANNQFNWSGDGTSGVLLWGAQLEVVTYQTIPSTYVSTTTAAYYGPRFDYDPVTLAAKGLLIEEQRTNLLTYSEQFDNAAWTKTSSTVVANATTSPDGSTDADRGVTGGSAFQTNQAITITSGATVSGSVYLKPNGIDVVEIVLLSSGNITPYGRASFNVATGIISTAATTANGGTNVSAAITPAGNGWYRCSVTVTYPAVTAAGMRINATGATGGIFLWGAQVEAGAFATSYIPTVASQVTRSADIATMTGTNFSSWYNQSEGTIVASVDTFAPSGANILSFQDGAGASTNRHQMSVYTVFTATVVGGVTQANMGTNSNISPNLAYAYKTNDFAASANGGTVATDTSGTVPSTLAYATLGKWDFGTAASLNGHIRSIAYYNTRLPDATLQSLTI